MPTYQSEVMKTNLWKGSVLGTIAYAVWVIQHPSLSNEQSWDGINYNIQNNMGAYGTITFASQGIVAAFFDLHSPKNPFISDRDYDQVRFLNGIPKELLLVAEEETLQYLIQEYRDNQMPIITTAFWSENDYLFAAESWKEVFKNGAHLIQNQLLEIDAAIIQWQVNYNLSDSQVDLVLGLFIRRMEKLNHPVIFTSQEVATLITNGDEGINISRELLTAVGITLY
jgi:hypothetical protein